MKEIRLYLSDDGKSFNTESECLAYEHAVAERKLNVKNYSFDCTSFTELTMFTSESSDEFDNYINSYGLEYDIHKDYFYIRDDCESKIGKFVIAYEEGMGWCVVFSIESILDMFTKTAEFLNNYMKGE